MNSGHKTICEITTRVPVYTQLGQPGMYPDEKPQYTPPKCAGYPTHTTVNWLVAPPDHMNESKQLLTISSSLVARWVQLARTHYANREIPNGEKIFPHKLDYT